MIQECPSTRRPDCDGLVVVHARVEQERQLAMLIKASEEEALGDYLLVGSALVACEKACGAMGVTCGAMGGGERDLRGQGEAAEQRRITLSAAAATRAMCIEIMFKIFDINQVNIGTICSCIKLLDLFLSKACVMCEGHHQFSDVAALCRAPTLISLSCFLITCKFREVLCPLLSDLEEMSGGRYRTNQIRDAEVLILSVIDWKLHALTVADICGMIMAPAPRTAYTLMKQHIELAVEVACATQSMLGFSATSMAVAAILISAERLDIPFELLDWIPTWVLNAADESAMDCLRSSHHALEGRACDGHVDARASPSCTVSVDVDDLFKTPRVSQVRNLYSPHNADALPGWFPS